MRVKILFVIAVAFVFCAGCLPAESDPTEPDSTGPDPTEPDPTEPDPTDRDPNTPALVVKITDWPDYGSYEQELILGFTENADSKKHGVAVYIQGRDTVWYPKSDVGAIAPISEDGFWEMIITTHPNDIFAVSILASLVSLDAQLPACWPELCLEMPDIEGELAHDIVIREPILPKINFVGYEWEIKDIGPGPSYFSTSSENVWVDEYGLHLTVSYQDQWYSTEVQSVDSFGYGVYYFQTYGRIDLLDPNVVFGMFTWDREATDLFHREIDIEFTRWGDPLNETNAQFVVHPCFECPGCLNCKRFYADLETFSEPWMNHFIVWRPDEVEFFSYIGRYSQKLASSWYYRGDNVPIPGKEKVFLNLWLIENAPLYGQEQEVIITDFSFQSLS